MFSNEILRKIFNLKSVWSNEYFVNCTEQTAVKIAKLRLRCTLNWKARNACIEIHNISRKNLLEISHLEDHKRNGGIKWRWILRKHIMKCTLRSYRVHQNNSYGNYVMNLKNHSEWIDHNNLKILDCSKSGIAGCNSDRRISVHYVLVSRVCVLGRGNPLITLSLNENRSRDCETLWTQEHASIYES